MFSNEYTAIPAGIPPANLLSGDDDAILEWCRACQSARPDERLANEAFKYWLRYFHRVRTPEHERICGRIDALVEDIAQMRALPPSDSGGLEPASEG